MKYIVEQGASVSHRDKNGKTAREYALEMQQNSKGKQEQVVAKNILSLLPEWSINQDNSLLFMKYY